MFSPLGTRAAFRLARGRGRAGLSQHLETPTHHRQPNPIPIPVIDICALHDPDVSEAVRRDTGQAVARALLQFGFFYAQNTPITNPALINCKAKPCPASSIGPQTKLKEEALHWARWFYALPPEDKLYCATRTLNARTSSDTAPNSRGYYEYVGDPRNHYWDRIEAFQVGSDVASASQLRGPYFKSIGLAADEGVDL